MKAIFTLLLLLIAGSLSAQYNRTFLNNHTVRHSTSYAHYSLIDSQNKVHLYSLVYSSVISNNIQLYHQVISENGDLELFEENNYAVALPNATGMKFFLGIIESGNERHMIISVKNSTNNNSRIVWIKVNKNTGALIQTQTSSEEYKLFYLEPKLNDDYIVFYAPKSTNGLVRVALNKVNYNPPTTEVVDANLNTIGLTNIYNYSSQSGQLYIKNGIERIVWGNGYSTVKFIIRNGSNIYTSIDTGIPTSKGTNSILKNPSQIGVTNGQIIKYFNDYGSEVGNGMFPFSSAFINSTPLTHLEYSNNQFHAYFRQHPSNYGEYFRINQSYQILDSLETDIKIAHIKAVSNGVLLTGISLVSSHQINLAFEVNGSSIYSELFDLAPKLKIEEYSKNIQFDDIQIALGIGTNITNSKYELPVKMDSIPIIYSVKDVFSTIKNTDTFINLINHDNYDTSHYYMELPGPYTPTSNYNELIESKYNRPFYITSEMIQNHIDSIASGSSNYQPIWEISNWPGNGNSAIGQASQIAPYADLNSNGVYEPNLGEYPRIYGNRCVFSISHTQTFGDQSKAIEFLSYVYAMNCDTNSTFKNVLMRKLQVISRGAEFDSVFFGGYFDADLGNYNDDYAGTNAELGLTYFFNGDTYDENSSGKLGFQDRLASVGILCLKGFKQEDDGVDNDFDITKTCSINGFGYNDGIVDNEFSGLFSNNITNGVSSPTLSEWVGFTNMLNGLNYGGDVMYYGEYGALSPNSTTIQSKYHYSGYRDSLYVATEGVNSGFEWSELIPYNNAIPNPTGDRRSIFSFGGTTMTNSTSFEFDYAILAQRLKDTCSNVFDPVDTLFAKANAIRSAFRSNTGSCDINFDLTPTNLSSTIEQLNDGFSVYPNPTTNSFKIANVSESGASVLIYDLQGKLIMNIENYDSNESIQLSELKNQLYFIKIADDQKTEIKKIIKVE